MSAVLLASLRARLDALAERADPVPLLEDQAAEEARDLVAALTPQGGTDNMDPATLETLGVAALVHWQRHCLRDEDLEAGGGEESDNDLAAAIELYSRIHRHDPLAVPEPLLHLIDDPNGPDREDDPLTWDDMAQPYLERFWGGDLGALRTAVQLLSAALDAAAEDAPDRPTIVLRLAGALLSLHEVAGDRGALALWEEIARAEDVRPVGSSAEALAFLSLAMLVRFGQSGDEGALEEAVRTALRALDSVPPGAVGPEVAGALGAALYWAFSAVDGAQGMSLGLSFLREAVAQTPVESPELAARLSRLGEALLDSYGRTGDMAELSDALDAARSAVVGATGDDEQRVTAITILAWALQERHRREGDPADLDQAIRLWRQVLDGLPATAPARREVTARLGAALWMLYQRSGDSGALSEAIGHTKAALDATPGGHHDRPGALGNLAAMLRTRFLHIARSEDLQEALRLLHEAVRLLPYGHPERPAHLSNLSNVLRSNYELYGDPTALDEAIDAGREAVFSTPIGHQDRPSLLGNLGASLRARFASMGRLDDLDEAIAVQRAAVAEHGDGHSGRAVQLANLGNALRHRYEVVGIPQDAAEGLEALRAAAMTPHALPLVRMRAAWACADAARRDGHIEEALECFRLAVEMLPRIAPGSLRRGDREDRLERFAGLGSEAAAAALDAGRPDLALELLEQARGILLGEVLAAQGDSADLIARAPDLYAEFQRQREALSRPEAEPGEHMSNGSRLEETISRIRALDGFDRFLLPPTAAELLRGMDGGPVVVVNVASHRSDALVLGAGHRAEVQVVPLPGLTDVQVAAQTGQFLTAIIRATDSGLRDRMHAQLQISQTLGWLWDTAVEPVLESLGLTGPPTEDAPWPRVWWCPVGPLACLPLHAAGREGGRGDSALDRVVSSYTPTVQALVASRRRARVALPPTGNGSTALIVAMPETPGVPGRLPFAMAEAESLAATMPGSTLLTGPDALRATVLSELAGHTVVHFACHGVTDWGEPSTNRLLLADGALSASELLDHRIEETELVVLLACSSATTGGAVSDEAVHLASSFLAAGVPHVVGTLWAVLDHVAEQTATVLYGHLTADGTTPPHTALTAAALNEAARALREQYPRMPGLWAPFVHIGL